MTATPQTVFPLVSLRDWAQEAGVDLQAAFVRLQALYDEIDTRNEALAQNLDLPCHKGCSMCCHESVFLTPLEFFYAWDHVQQTTGASERQEIVEAGLRLYDAHREQILALEAPVAQGAQDHFDVAKSLRFACPMLSAAGACRVYPARELLARLFGCSFNDAGGLYACHLVAQHVGSQTVTLLRARPTWKRLLDLPLTHKRQVYPYYIHLLYGQHQP